jgi:predicted secreted protein
MILKTLPLGVRMVVDEESLSAVTSAPALPLGVRMVVDEESLSAVTSAPELTHNKTCWFQKNDSRVDFSISFWNRILV